MGNRTILGNSNNASNSNNLSSANGCGGCGGNGNQSDNQSDHDNNNFERGNETMEQNGGTVERNNGQGVGQNPSSEKVVGLTEKLRAKVLSLRVDELKAEFEARGADKLVADRTLAGVTEEFRGMGLDELKREYQNLRAAARANEAPVTGEEGKGRGKSSRGENKRTAREIAREVIAGFGKPLVSVGGRLLALDFEKGWRDCANEISNLVSELVGFEDLRIIRQINLLTNLCDGETLQKSVYFQRRQEAMNDWEPFEVKENQVVFANGILTLRVGKEGSFAPTPGRGKYNFRQFDDSTQPIYGPMISLPFTKTLLKELDQTNEEEMFFPRAVENALPDKVERDILQKCAGGVLQPHVLSRYINVFLGVPYSGKTSLATAIGCAPAGVEGIFKCSEKELGEGKFRTAGLFHKFAFVSDDSDKSPKAEALYKQITSGTIAIEEKYSKTITTAVTFKVFLTCNEINQIVDTSGAIVDRYRIFQFNKRLPVSNSISKDRYMGINYWLQEDRRIGVLKWMLQGIQMVLDEGLETPEFMRNRAIQNIADNCPYRDFLVNHVVETGNEEDFLYSSDLVASMKNIAGLRITTKTLSSFMTSVFNRCQSSQKTNGARKGLRGYQGFRMISNLD